MAASVGTLRRQVATMRAIAQPPREPRQYVIQLEEGEEIAPELLAQLGPYDQVIVREIPRGYLDFAQEGQIMTCWLQGPGGKKTAHVVRQYGVDIGEV